MHGVRRRCFPAVVKLLDHIMGNLSTLPAGAEVDINNVAMRLALDMTGAAPCPCMLLVYSRGHSDGQVILNGRCGGKDAN